MMMMMDEMMECPYDKNQKIIKESNFLDQVFSWSIDDIFNDDLYKEKVRKIPETFETASEYFSSYKYPLLEETRAELRSSLEIISRAPFTEVVSYSEAKPYNSLMFNLNVDGWRNRFNDRGKEPYKTLPGDVFALVKFRPETINDLQVVARTWVLASVTKIPRGNAEEEIDDASASTFFTVKTSKDIGDVDDGYSSQFLVFLMNITTNKRIWSALHMHVNSKMIKGVLQRDMKGDLSDNLCSCMGKGLPEDLREYISARLNPSQREAVLGSVLAMQCNHKSEIHLVWGPPGTGKTKTIGTLLYLLLRMNIRTLACAPTNVAITEVASRVLGSIESSSSENGNTCSVGDVLLFGNKQRLRLGSDIEDIFLDYRVDRLAECFAPLTGWKNCFPCLSNFLDNSVSEYDVFVQNELFKREQDSVENDANSEIESFVVFFRIRFKAAVESVRRCIYILGTHIARSFIGESNLTLLKHLNDLLDSFEDMLLQDVDSAELMRLFSSEEVKDSLLDMLPPIEVTRRQCICFLKTLHKSLSDLSLPDGMCKDTLRDLCFRMASLIFCTASNSSRLYFMPIEPLSVLVIDEAAQLKECESAIPLQLPGLGHAILFGDECQLPAMVNSNIAGKSGFGRSLFQRLSLLGWPKHLLNVQYRMHPSISAFPNAEFYFNQILDFPSVQKKSYERRYLVGSMYSSYSFVNISEGREELDDDGCSRRNIIEAAVVAKILQNLCKSWRHSTQRLTVGIISPYAAQVVAIEDMLGKRYENLNNFGVKVKTVDGFQGGEEDIVILSTVRSNSAGEVGFISDPQRTNVALTRARHCLWVLGNQRTLVKSDSVWKALVCNAKERNCLFNADEDKSLTEAIIEVKKELNQLDDLLNKDSIVFKSARWKVLFSDNFLKSFAKLPSVRTKKSVMNILVKLSNGWRPKKIRVDPVCESSIQIVKQYKVEGRYIICTNDIVKDSRYIQVMKIWDVIPLEDVSKLVRRLDNIYGAFTDDFLSHCKEKSLEGELEVPSTWSTSFEIVRHKKTLESASAADSDLDGLKYSENTNVSESLLLMKFYSLSAGTVSHLLSDADGRALDLPFEVTDQELQIILHSSSSFILGRSGTGKTTVLTMKLFQKEQLHHMALEGLTDGSSQNSTHSDVSLGSGSVLRQIFVTVSPRLCYAIKQHVSHLKSFARGERSPTENFQLDDDGIDGGDQFKAIADSFVDVPPKSYPLVITFNKFLLMLDGTLGSSYFLRFHGELESSYGEITGLRSSALIMKRKEVNYEKFCSSYWPHFNSQFTKRLDASRVFTEIISCIKGGLQVGETDDGRLSLEGYLQLSEGRTSTLSRQKREAIYQIFLVYEKMKVERREYDLADLVNDLHRRLKHEIYRGDLIDFVYIDEVQDLTMRQISLFKFICKNVDEGFVFSGDTAQTIAKGIDFRFQDVRCLFFKEFLVNRATDRVSGNNEKGHISPIFHLSENFRTHAGILKLGQSVVELLYHFFPHSVDILPPETSRIFGEAPILLESGSNENAIVTIFGNTGNVGCNLVGFGAEQVILVRDDCVRKEISNFVGKNALVLTIVECKGLEFQDVLLYNFFGSSPLKNQWRVVYEYMDLKNLLDSTPSLSFPEFNSGKHNVLCSELKQLYVAITRTRQRLWICENVDDLSKPMFDYWKKLCVVQVRQLDDTLARAMQVASSPEEWKARGRKLLAVENYEVATMCFERAGDKHWETYAKAAGLIASAGRMSELNPVEASNILRQAAELFESIQVHKKAADCYFELKEYDKAGKIYFQQCEDSHLKRAGECFTLAGSYELAATVFAKGNFFSECLSSCTKGKLFDMGLQYIQFWKHQKTANLDVIEQVFLENCALSQYQQNDKKAMMKFVKAFSSEGLMRIFLKKWGCIEELLILEEELGNFTEAADIASERGDYLLEADLLQKGCLFKEACEITLFYIFASCLWAEGSKGWPLKHFKQKEELLLKAKSAAHNLGQRHFYLKVSADILILLNRNYSLAQLQEFLVLSLDYGNLQGEFLCTRRILDSILKIHASKIELEIDLTRKLTLHSLHKVFKSKVSVETLIYFWNLWNGTIFGILKYIDAVEANTTNYIAEHEKLCLNYLGVRKQCLNVSIVYVCLYPEAEWLKEVPKTYIQKFGKLASVDLPKLLTAARKYWSNELACTGVEVLRVLDSVWSSADPLCESGRVKVLLVLYEVAQFLFSLKSFTLSHQDAKLLQRNIDNCLVQYFGFVFPLDWRKVVSEDNICLREIGISCKVMEDFILKNVPMKEEWTYGQLGRVSMGLLGSRKYKPELYEMIVNRIDKNSPWRPFFEVLSACKRSEMISQTTSKHLPDAQALEFALARKLLGVLRDAYNANWRVRDFISPYCFLYLVDRLMVSLVELHGHLLVTRSSLVEWLIHLEWKGSLIRDLSTFRSECAFVNEVYHFLADVAHQLLVNTRETLEWVKKVGIIAKDNFPLLVLRLVTIMCRVHLNSGGGYWHLLMDVLNKRDVTSQLPPAFFKALRRKPNNMFGPVIEAMNLIGDPIVLLRIKKSSSPLKSSNNVIALDISGQSRDALLRILFPNKANTCPETVNSPNSMCSSSHSPVMDTTGKGKVLKSSVTDQGSQSHKISEHCLNFQDGSAWELFETLKLVRDQNVANPQRFVSNSVNIKVQVDALYKFMTKAVSVTSENASIDDEEYMSFLSESDCMLVELQLLSAILTTSEKELKDSMSLIRDSADKLLSGQNVFEYFLGPLIPPKDSKSNQEKAEADNVKDEQVEVEATEDNTIEQSQKDDTSVVAGGKQQDNQGEAGKKGKPNSQKRKGKNKKGKKK